MGESVLVSNDHTFAIDLHAVGNEGVDVHAGSEIRGVDDVHDIAALLDIHAVNLLALKVVYADEGGGYTLRYIALNRGSGVEGIGLVLLKGGL